MRQQKSIFNYQPKEEKKRNFQTCGKGKIMANLLLCNKEEGRGGEGRAQDKQQEEE